MNEQQFAGLIRLIYEGRVAKVRLVEGAVRKNLKRLRTSSKQAEPFEEIAKDSSAIEPASVIDWANHIRKSDADGKQKLARVAATIRRRFL